MGYLMEDELKLSEKDFLAVFVIGCMFGRM